MILGIIVVACCTLLVGWTIPKLLADKAYINLVINIVCVLILWFFLYRAYDSSKDNKYTVTFELTTQKPINNKHVQALMESYLEVNGNAFDPTKLPEYIQEFSITNVKVK